MKYNLTDALISLGTVIDAAEDDNGITVNHAKRVTACVNKLGLVYGLNKSDERTLCALSMLHDNGLTDATKEEFELVNNPDPSRVGELARHCSTGEMNLSYLPFGRNVTEVILYHHENADGSGPFGKTFKEVPLFSRMIHLADEIDLRFDLRTINEEKFDAISAFVKENTGTLFDEEMSELYFRTFTMTDFAHMNDIEIETLLRLVLQDDDIYFNEEETKQLAQFIGNIIDSKSTYTSMHSMKVAEKCDIMSHYYHFNKEKSSRFYLAGAVHDIGKMIIRKTLLDKPARLTNEEFSEMREHAYYTYRFLNSIHGFEDITRWASTHHEKLNGTGYPFSFNEHELGFEERLLACIDIYEALREERPYKSALDHHKALTLMKEMAARHKIDQSIVDDIDTVFSENGQSF